MRKGKDLATVFRMYPGMNKFTHTIDGNVVDHTVAITDIDLEGEQFPLCMIKELESDDNSYTSLQAGNGPYRVISFALLVVCILNTLICIYFYCKEYSARYKKTIDEIGANKARVRNQGCTSFSYFKEVVIIAVRIHFLFKNFLS